MKAVFSKKSDQKSVFKSRSLVLKNFMFFVVLIAGSLSYGQTTSTFTTSGSWKCPSGVTSVQVEAWGAGGGAGVGKSGQGSYGGGGAGGGGYIKVLNVVVVPGTSYSITVGSGGISSATQQGNGAAGGNSVITLGSVIITANGGNGGSGTSGVGANGGSASVIGAVAAVITNGNNGSANSGNNGGAGGSGGNGGAGGAAVSSGNGNSGTAPGGGGGGGYKGYAAGNGGAGQIKLTFTCPSPQIVNAGADQNLVSCGNATMAGSAIPTHMTGLWTVSPAGPTIIDATSPSTDIEGGSLSTPYTYTWTITNGDCGVEGADNVTITTGTAGASCWTYCSSSPSAGSFEAIGGVQISGSDADFNSNSNVDNEYVDYYNTYVCEALQGNSFNVIVSKITGSTWYSTDIAYIFIDLNNDGDFSDPGEMVGSGSGATSPYTINVTIPYSATAGKTRMRVKFGDSGAGSAIDSNPCQTGWTYGEVEDYGIRIIANAACSGTPTVSNMSASESISCTSLSRTSDLTLDTPMSGSGYSYQWQESAVGAGSWSNISGATSDSYTVSLSSASKDFRLAVTCDNSGLVGYSNTQTITYDCTCTPVDLYWGGYASGMAGATSSQDPSNPANWSTSSSTLVPVSSIQSCDNLNFDITNTSLGFDLTADLTCGDLIFTCNGSNSIPDFSVGIYTLTINGDLTVKALSGNNGTYPFFGNFGSDAGTVIVNGNAEIGNAAYLAYLSGTNTTFQFNGNLTFGINGLTSSSYKPLSITFNGTEPQTYTNDRTTVSNPICSGDFIVGVTNASSVTFAGAGGVQTVGGNLTVGANSTLDLNGKTLNREVAGGALTLNSGSTLKIGGTTAYPTNYSTSSLNVSSTVDFNGSTQTISATPSYGNLKVNSIGTKTLGGATTVNGNLDVVSGTLATANNGLSVKGNVTIDGTFTPGTGTLTLNGTSAQSIGGSGALNFYGLTLNNSNGLTLSKSIDVSNTLTLTSGRITLGSNNLTIGTSASIGGTPSSSNMIVASGTGELRKRFTSGLSDQPLFIFPVGTIAGGNEYTPVELDFSSGNFNSEAYVGVRVVDQRSSFMSASLSNYINRNWFIEPSGITSPLYDITLHYVESDWIGNAGAESSVLPIKYSIVSGAGMWYQPEGGGFTNAQPIGSGFGNSTQNFLNWQSVNSFSEFGGAEGNNQPLPVELVSFSGACDEGVISLTWQTASEFNSSHFEVEKSRDGENWQMLSTIPSAGTSNELITYQSTDQNGTEGNNYFRLRQVDIDGTEKLYNPINVSCSEVTTGYFSSFPNPSGNAFQIILNNEDLVGESVLNLVDAQGKVIEQRVIDVKSGINMFVINQNLNPGMYFLNISNGSKSTPVIRHSIK